MISIWLGLRGRRGQGPGRRIRLAVNVAFALALLPATLVALENLESGGTSYIYAEPTPGLALEGVQIRNVYPYNREGEPLFDVLLFDENGQPISLVSGLTTPRAAFSPTRAARSSSIRFRFATSIPGRRP